MPVVIPPSPDLPPSTLTYIHAYKSIVRRFRANRTKGAASVVILAGVDADALLASSLLITLLKQDDIPHTLIPISGYAELERRKKEMFGKAGDEQDDEEDHGENEGEKKDFSDIQSLLLLSLGSLLPITRTFPLPAHLHIHLIDAHRPYNLENLFGPGVVDGLGDGVLEERRFARGAGGAQNGKGNGRGGFGGSGSEDGNGDGEGEEVESAGRVWVWTDADERKLESVKRSWEALEYEPEEDSESDSDSQSDTDPESSDNDDSDESDRTDSDVDEEDPEDTEQDEEDEEGSLIGPANGRTGDGRTKGKRKRSEKDAGTGATKKRKRKVKGIKGKRADGDEGQVDKPRRLPAAHREAHAKRVQKYYHTGTSYGLSAVESLYCLASEMERGDNDLLWLAIIGLTFQYITTKLDRDDYERRYQMYIDEVARLNPSRHGQGEQGNGLLPAGQNGSSPGADDSSITQSEELRFVLYKHWNLYEAMFHSSYVAGRMGIWKERGRKRLMGLLAKMGYSGQQCRQSYAHMDMDLKNGLRDKLENVAPEYGLIELTYPSFVRAYGYRCSALSGADAIEGIEALLEAGTGIRIDVEHDGGKGGGEWFSGIKSWKARGDIEDKQSGSTVRQAPNSAAVTGDDVDKTEVTSAIEQKRYQTNFWIAYDALDDIDLLRRSLSLARALHQAIIRQGCSILDKGAIRGLRAFRFVTIKEGPDMKLFCNPSTLSRLANWLVDATRDKLIRKAEQQNGEAAHPIVLACLNEEKGTYVVVGVTGSPEFGDIGHNQFGLAFQSAAEESGAGTRHDMFDTSIIEIRQDDLTSFIESLHLSSI